MFLLTVELGIEYQQEFGNRKIAMVILCAKSIALNHLTPVLRKNSMDDIDPSFECSAFCSLLPGVSLVGTAA